MRPLKGLKVVAIEQAVAAPFATMRLADAGAEVIKIERPGGDFARGYDTAAAGQSSYFVWLNRGKASRVLDLREEAARAELETLIAGADVLVQNLRRGALARLGFDIARLRKDYPRLITCSITGYGDAGPLRDRKAYDLLVQAEVGLASITGGPEGPARVGVSVVDIGTGAAAHAAILEALIQRGITGAGTAIDLSMFDVVAEWMTVPLLNHEAGRTPTRVGLSHPSIAPYGVFTCADGAAILISIQSDREWRRLATEVLGQASLAEDPDFATNVARVQNRARTDGLVAAAFDAQDSAGLRAILEQADIAFAEVTELEGLAAHPLLRRQAVETPGGAVSIPRSAPLFDGQERELGNLPPIGQSPKRSA